jgi:hypothetical protein
MFVAGHFNAFYSFAGSLTSFVNIGSTRSGYEVQTTLHTQPITDDAFGESQLDGIQQGMDKIIRLEYIEYDRIVNCLYVQTSSGASAGEPLAGKQSIVNQNVGLTLQSLSGTLVLVPVVGTPAATQIGVGMCRVFPIAIIDSDFSVLLGSKLRQGPCTFRTLPSAANGAANEIIAATSGYANTSAVNPVGVTSTSPFWTAF